MKTRSIGWLTAVLLTVMPVSSTWAQSDEEPSPPPELAIPADAASAGGLDLADLESKLELQSETRLGEILRGWVALLRKQQAAVGKALESEEGSEAREQLDALRTDRDALLEQAKSIVAELKRRGDKFEAKHLRSIRVVEKIQADVAPALVKATATEEERAKVEQRNLSKISTAPGDEVAALEVDIAVLEAQLRPLRLGQVESDLEAWLSLVQSKAVALRNVEISAYKAESSEETERFNERAVSLREERDQLIRRARTVVRALELKGGQVALPTAYLDSLTSRPPITGIYAFWIQTRATVFRWFVAPEGGLSLFLALARSVSILLCFHILSILLGGVIHRGMLAISQTSDLLREFVVNSSRKVLSFVGVVLALEQLGLDIGPFLAAIGAAGFVIGFALQGTLSNFASGVMIMLYRPYDVGDVVTVGGVSGTVNSMTLVSTSIKTFDNQSIIVPNNKIWGDVITNVTANRVRRVDMVFGVGYKDDIDHVLRVLEEVVQSHEKVLSDPKPVIRLHELGDSSVNFIVRPWTRTADYWAVYWDLQQAVKKRFDAEEISIPYPQSDVHLHRLGVD